MHLVSSFFFFPPPVHPFCHLSSLREMGFIDICSLRKKERGGIHLPINSMTNFCLVQAEHESRRHINHHDHPGTIGIQLR